MVARPRAIRFATMVAFVTLALNTRAPSAMVVLPAGLDGTVSHSFDTFLNVVRDNLGMTNGSFVTDLGTLDSITAALSVDAGDIINVSLPAGKTGTMFVNLGYLGGGSYGASDVWTNNGGQFLGLVGTAPTLSSLQTRGRVQGNDVNIQASYTFTESFSFTGWGADMYSPFISGGSLTFVPNTTVFTFTYPDTADGGQFVTISSVPEPSHASPLALALGLLLFSRRRRALARFLSGVRRPSVFAQKAFHRQPARAQPWEKM